MLDLYIRQTCPFSKKVRDYIEDNELGAQVREIDVDKEDETLERLQAVTGRTQVPVLMIDGRPILESDEIINWLKTNLVGESAHEQTQTSL